MLEVRGDDGQLPVEQQHPEPKPNDHGVLYVLTETRIADCTCSNDTKAQQDKDKQKVLVCKIIT